MQIAGNPVAVGEQGQPLRIPPVLGQLQPDACLGRERGHHLHRGRRQRQRALPPPGGQHAAHIARRPQRDDHGGPEAKLLAGRLCHPLVAAEVVDGQRLAGGHHHPRRRAGQRQHQAQGRGGTGPAGVLDGQHIAAAGGQGQHDQIRPGYLQRLLGHQGQHIARLVLGHQPLGDLGVGPQPLLLPLCLGVEPGVVDGHARGRGERHHERLVVLVEGAAAAFLGEVQVAEHLVADLDRRAQERPHRRVPVREA